jgi:hypothetical protein
MLKPGEKSYFLALEAVRDKDYARAAEQFNRAAPHFEHNREFRLLKETTGMLVAVKEELGKLAERTDTVVEEKPGRGEETDVRR